MINAKRLEFSMPIFIFIDMICLNCLLSTQKVNLMGGAEVFTYNFLIKYVSYKVRLKLTKSWSVIENSLKPYIMFLLYPPLKKGLSICSSSFEKHFNPHYLPKEGGVAATGIVGRTKPNPPPLPLLKKPGFIFLYQ